MLIILHVHIQNLFLYCVAENVQGRKLSPKPRICVHFLPGKIFTVYICTHMYIQYIVLRREAIRMYIYIYVLLYSFKGPSAS